MREQRVEFYSEGDAVAGLWRGPDDPAARNGMTIVHPPGWSGRKDSTLYATFDEQLSAAGFEVLIFDYRGYGDSALPPGRRSLRGQLADVRSAISYAQSRPDVDPERIGIFASGATGAAHAVTVASVDHRVRAVVCQYPIADGHAWIRSGLSMGEWERLRADLDRDRVARAASGAGAVIDRVSLRPRPADRDSVPLVADLGVEDQLPLSFVDELLEYRPVDAARSVTAPVMIITAEGDTMTDPAGARAIHDQLRGHKALLIMRHTTHSEAYARFGSQVMKRACEWFGAHLAVLPELAEVVAPPATGTRRGR